MVLYIANTYNFSNEEWEEEDEEYNYLRSVMMEDGVANTLTKVRRFGETDYFHFYPEELIVLKRYERPVSL